MSTDREEQEHSFETQKQMYTDMIMMKPNWQMAGIYADEGITGTIAKKRPGFMKMIEDCRKGKIDIIITKSVSRFSRNNLDCLMYVRELKGKGIPIIFEKEGINTLQVSSELLIALFGGIAGMLETSRKERGTVISGVAIATALMPPLCTVGYGISLLNWHYILGALYLFLINSIFIALATFLTTKYLRFPLVMEEEVDGMRQRLSKRAIAFILLVMIVPSIFSAIRMVQENNFNIHAEKLVSKNKSIGKSFIYDYKTDMSVKPATIDLYLAGETLTPEFKEVLFKDAEEYGITRNQIVFHEDATMTRDVLSESDLIQGIYEYNERQIKALTDSIATLERQLDTYRDHDIPVDAIARELFAQYPSIRSISLTGGRTATASGEAGKEQIVALVTSSEKLDGEMTDRLERWLKARLEQENVIVLQR